MEEQEKAQGVDLLNDFMGQVSAEDKAKLQKKTDDASGDERAKPLKASGKYRAKVSTFGFIGKDDQPVYYPSLQKSKEKGTLQLVVQFSTLDSTECAKSGSYINVYVPLLAAPKFEKETDEAYQKRMNGTQSMCKRYLSTLLGTTEIHVTDAAWVANNLLAVFKNEDGKITMVRDHKMKKTLYITVEDDVYNEKPSWRVVDVSTAQLGDKSFSNKPVNQPESKTAATPATSNVDLANMTADPADIAETGMGFQPEIPDEV